MNKKKELDKPKEVVKHYYGYFLMDSGYKVKFDVAEYDDFGIFEQLHDGDCTQALKQGDTIWMGEDDDYILLADRIIGWSVSMYERTE